MKQFGLPRLAASSPLMKRVSNRFLDLLYIPALDRFWARSMRGTVTCLLYHRVDAPERHPFLGKGGSPVISPEELKGDIGFLASLGVRFMTFADLRAGRFVARHEVGIIVSFDDGFRDNYTAGLEVLEDMGVKAVFFQTSGLIDAEDLIWEHALYWHTRDDESAAVFQARTASLFPELAGTDAGQAVRSLRETVGPQAVAELLAGLRDEGSRDVARSIYPRAEDLRRARSLGHEIGSHGHKHLKRTSIDAQTFAEDLALSRGALSAVLGEAPRAFSYPFNSYRMEDRAITKQHFEQAATVDAGRITTSTDPLWLPRFTWPGSARNALRRRRWLLAGRI